MSDDSNVISNVGNVATHLQAIFQAWRRGVVSSARRPGLGAIHQTWLLDTTTEQYALKGYRHRQRQPIEVEHTLIAHATARNVPAPTPLALPDGATILALPDSMSDRGEEASQRYYALFPFARGQQIARDALGEREAAAMGTFLAQLHLALADLPHDLARRRPLAEKIAEAHEQARRLEAVLQAWPLRDAVDERALARLTTQRAWIEQFTEAEAVARTDELQVALTALGEQVIHGDYQEGNLFFADAGDGTLQVSDIIDWDQAYLAPRAWEAIRTLDLCFALEPLRVCAFLAAYRAVAPLADAALGTAAQAYSWMRAHDFWVYEHIYAQGNVRYKHYIGRAPFVPFADRWLTLCATFDA